MEVWDILTTLDKNNLHKESILHIIVRSENTYSNENLSTSNEKLLRVDKLRLNISVKYCFMSKKIFLISTSYFWTLIPDILKEILQSLPINPELLQGPQEKTKFNWNSLLYILSFSIHIFFFVVVCFILNKILWKENSSDQRVIIALCNSMCMQCFHYFLLAP